jgi:hypothetical protein
MLEAKEVPTRVAQSAGRLSLVSNISLQSPMLGVGGDVRVLPELATCVHGSDHIDYAYLD